MSDAREGAARCSAPKVTPDVATPATSSEASGVSRREALGILGAALLGLPAIGGGLSSVAAFASVPRRSFADGANVPDEVPGGLVSDLAQGVPRTIMFGDETVFVVKLGKDIHALSATCTHLGCLLAYHPDVKRFVCPCHGSTFKLTGEYIGGPAPRRMDEHEIRIALGRIIVGKRKDLDPGVSGAPTC